MPPSTDAERPWTFASAAFRLHGTTGDLPGLRGRRFTLFLHSHLNELWSINTHYFEFTEQFCEIVSRYQVPPDVIEQYNKFAVEYNVFVENFRDTITELRNIARTQIEAPSIRLARELPAIRR